MRAIAIGLATLALGAGLAGGALGAGKKGPPPPPEVTRIGAGAFPISTSVKVPAGSTLVFVSGLTPDVTAPGLPGADPASYGDTATQTVSVIRKIQAALQAQGLDLKDIVMMHVYLVGDPAKGGKLDFAGMMAGYTKYFGTADQPNKPSRTTVQVAALANPAIMVEIDVVAAKAN
jgi:enamine deaminase RidA (YjgF/YER057c/UK114 family)